MNNELPVRNAIVKAIAGGRIKHRKKVLYIDTTNKTSTIVSLIVSNQTFTVKKDSKNYKDQVLLIVIQKLLEEHSLTVQDIDEVEVNPGPGSFTGIRVGVSVANAVIYALGLQEKSIEPLY